jgi:hypothetical protein
LPLIQYQKASFHHFVEEPYRSFIQGHQKFQSVKQQDLQTLRSILDSKFYEYLSIDDVRQITRFPEFVYSWLYTFQMHPQRIKITLVDEIDEQNIIAFYQFVLEYSENLWVCIFYSRKYL